MSIISATKLSSLFENNPRCGQEVFPELIKNLVIASANCKAIRFPSGDAIWAPGFDGIVNNICEDVLNVPSGNSVWELGTNKDYKNKFELDFTKRTNEKKDYDKSNYTYAFCTPHIWSGNIIEWENEKSKINVWKKVKIIDAVVLSDWMEKNLEVAIWLLNKFADNNCDYTFSDITDLKTEINHIYNLTNPKLNNKIMLCSNEEKGKDLILTLSSNQQYHIIKPSVNLEQAYFFTLASIASSNEETLKSKVLIAKNRKALDLINKHCADKIVIVKFDGDFENDIRDNKYIFIVNDEIRTSTVVLNQVYFEDFRKALESIGIEQSESYDLTSKLNRNISIFKRKYAVNSMIKKPNWASNINNNYVLPIALLSVVDASKTSHREIVCKLVNVDFNTFIEKLDEILVCDDSPIFKDGTKYRIYSKEEALMVLGVNFDATKLLMLEKICKEEIFCFHNPKFNKDISSWHIQDEEYKYSGGIICGILTTFAILSNKHNAQNHYDQFIAELFLIIKQQSALIHTFASNFSLMTEISANASIRFFDSILGSDTTIANQLSINYGVSFFPSNDMLQVAWALEQCLSRKDYAVEALGVLLKLYLQDINNASKQQIDEMIIKSFSPILSMEQELTPTQKMDILLKSAESFTENDKVLAENIFYKMMWNQVNSYMSPSRPKWKTCKKHDNTYSPSAFAMVNELAKNWLCDNGSNKPKLITKLINISLMDGATEEYIKNAFKRVNEKLVDKIKNEEGKRLLNLEVASLIKKFRRFGLDDKVLNNLIIENLIIIFEKTLPSDLFQRYRGMFENSNYSITDDYDEDISWEESQKNSICNFNNAIMELIKQYSINIFDEIIKITNANNYWAWLAIFEFVKDDVKFMKNLLALKKENVFCDYIGTKKVITSDAKDLILENDNLEQKKYVIQHLPFNDITIKFAEENEIEREFWLNKTPHPSVINEVMYTKMLKLCPMNLVLYALKSDKGTNYDVAIEVLNAIYEFRFKNSNDSAWNNNSRHFFVSLIDKIDKLYYTDELAIIELKLLADYLSLSSGDNYPRGIQEFFWRNPNEFFSFYKQLFSENEDVLKNSNETIGKKMLFHAIQPLGKTCLIPNDYINSESIKLKEWCDTIIRYANNESTDIFQKFSSMIIHILALCPEKDGQEIWPPQAVADILDSMNKCWSDEDIDDVNKFYRERFKNDGFIETTKENHIASKFVITKTNSIGIRTVSDGSYEFEMAKKYNKFADSYRVKNPITFEALKILARRYHSDGERDRCSAIQGKHYIYVYI